MSDQENEQEKLRKDIFGGDESDSELSDEEDVAPKSKPQRAESPAGSASSPKDQQQDDDDEDEDADADADDDQADNYRQESSKKTQQREEEEEEDEERFVSAPRPEKEKRAGSDDEEYDAGESEKRKSKEKKKKKRSAEDGDGERQKKKKKKQRQASPGAGSGGEEAPIEFSEADRRRAMIDAKIDAAINQGKKKRPKKKAGEEDLDLLADDEVSALRNEMITAAESDEASNAAKKPGTAKLKLLPQVVNTLQKTALQQSILDNNLLEGVKRWLEPLPDKSLPALNIQRQFFAILEKMQIDTISLKMSGLGKIVLFYSKCPRVETAIKRIAERLVETWSRPVLKRSSSYRARHIPSAAYRYEEADGSQRLLEESSQDRPSTGSDNLRRMVSIPQAVQAGFKIAPKATAGGGGSDASHQARLANHQRLNKFKKNLKAKR